MCVFVQEMIAGLWQGLWLSKWVSSPWCGRRVSVWSLSWSKYKEVLVFGVRNPDSFVSEPKSLRNLFETIMNSMHWRNYLKQYFHACRSALFDFAPAQWYFLNPLILFICQTHHHAIKKVEKYTGWAAWAPLTKNYTTFMPSEMCLYLLRPGLCHYIHWVNKGVILGTAYVFVQALGSMLFMYT